MAEYTEQDGGPPDVLEKMGVGDSDVVRLVEAHTTMIAWIMSKEVTTTLIRETEACIKVRWENSCECFLGCLLLTSVFCEHPKGFPCIVSPF